MSNWFNYKGGGGRKYKNITFKEIKKKITKIQRRKKSGLPFNPFPRGLPICLPFSLSVFIKQSSSFSTHSLSCSEYIIIYATNRIKIDQRSRSWSTFFGFDGYFFVWIWINFILFRAYWIVYLWPIFAIFTLIWNFSFDFFFVPIWGSSFQTRFSVYIYIYL